VPAAVAAGDQATATAGAEILRAGGSATDAAVAAMLAACAAETVMTGLGGGGFATVWDATAGTATTVDFFVTTPGLGLDRPVADLQQIGVRFGPQHLEYYVGAASVAVPGVPFGLAELHRRWGRLPWADVVEPAYRLARDGVSISAMKATVLANIAEGMLNSPEGRAAYAPGGTMLAGGQRLFHEGLAAAFAALRDEGPDAFRSRGPVGAATVALSAARGGRLTAADLDAYTVEVADARRVPFAGHVVCARTDLLDLLGTLARLPADIGRIGAAPRALAWVAALLGTEHPHGTTNVCAVDAQGDACAVTTSLGLGAGDWVPGFGIHLNSMLGEGELMVGGLDPGHRVHSMMCPVVAVDDGRLALVAGAAGGSRIRSALVQTLTGVLAEDVPPVAAVDRPRLNPVPGDPLPGGGRKPPLVHVEPGFPADVVQALHAAGYRVHDWQEPSPYFGGVSMVGRGGPAADHRRDGAVALP
jgi:gamma-glutamyltranspeptidase/glutathione hydrolase